MPQLLCVKLEDPKKFTSQALRRSRAVIHLGEVVRLPPDIVTTNVYVVSLTGGFMALTGFELGSPDSEFDTLSTRPPRRDSYGVLEVPFVLFPRSTGIQIGLISALGLLMELASSAM